MRIFNFHLIEFVEDNNDFLSVSYLYKDKECHIYISIKKMNKGYCRVVSSYKSNIKEYSNHFYPTKEKSAEAIFDWIVHFYKEK